MVWHALDALARIGPGAAEAVPAVSTCLDDPDWRTAAEAAETLGAFGSGARPAVPALLRAVRRDSVAEAVAGALPRILDGLAPETLARLQHRFRWKREAAAAEIAATAASAG